MAKVTKDPKQFDPKKNYTWKLDDEFIIDGRQLQLLYNTFMEKTKDEAWVKIANEYEAFKTVQELFIRGVEQGVIVEAAEGAPSEAPAQQQ